MMSATWDTCWFRGCTSPDYALSPTLFREQTLKNREGYLSVEFRRRAHRRMPGLSSRFDWLCAMQHHGLPTRLLDWTESLSVATYFSIGDVDWHLVRPTIWMLDPFDLSSMTEDDSNIPIATDVRVDANADLAFCDDWDQSAKRVSELPLPVPRPTSCSIESRRKTEHSPSMEQMLAQLRQFFWSEGKAHSSSSSLVPSASLKS